MAAHRIPASSLPRCKMYRLIGHWTAGAGSPSAEDRAAYHWLVDRVGLLHAGDYSIRDNLSTGDGEYAAHTRGLNTGSIGLAICGMAGATESPFAPGRFPITRAAWNAFLIAAADLCRFYAIWPHERTLLMHREVESVYGIAQRGKWDIDPRALDFDRGRWTETTAGEELRERVKLLLREG